MLSDNIPESLLALGPHMRLADKLKDEEPNTSFFLKLYISECGMNKLRETGDQKMHVWLMELTNELENMKSQNNYVEDMQNEGKKMEIKAWAALETAQKIKKEEKSQEGEPPLKEALLKKFGAFQTALIYFEALQVFEIQNEMSKKVILLCKISMRDSLREIKSLEHSQLQSKLSPLSTNTGDKPFNIDSPSEKHDLTHSVPNGTRKVDEQLSPVTADLQKPVVAKSSTIDFDSSVDRTVHIKSAERNAKHAISAMQFEDIQTAIKYLELSIKELKAL